MPWTEFCNLVSGLMPDTPLGQIVSIRAEKDSNTIRSFSPDQKRIYNEWNNKLTKKMLDNPDKLNKQMEEISGMLRTMFGKGVK